MAKIKCIWCKKTVTSRFKPMAQWDLSGDGYLCGDCYEKKLSEYYLPSDRRNLTKRADRRSDRNT